MWVQATSPVEDSYRTWKLLFEWTPPLMEAMRSAQRSTPLGDSLPHLSQHLALGNATSNDSPLPVTCMMKRESLMAGELLRLTSPHSHALVHRVLFLLRSSSWSSQRMTYPQSTSMDTSLYPCVLGLMNRSFGDGRHFSQGAPHLSRNITISVRTPNAPRVRVEGRIYCVDSKREFRVACPPVHQLGFEFRGALIIAKWAGASTLDLRVAPPGTDEYTSYNPRCTRQVSVQKRFGYL